MPVADHPSENTVEYPTRFLTMVLSTAVYALVAAFCVYSALHGHGPGTLVAAAVAAVPGYVAVLNVGRAVLRRPIVVLDDEGLKFNYGKDAVSWAEVASVALVPGFSSGAWKGLVSIELHDPEAYLAGLSDRRQRFARTAMARGLGPVRLAFEIFPVPPEEVVATMRRFHADLVVETA